MFIIEALEKLFSVILGVFIGIAIGAWYLLRAVFRLITGILRKLLELACPPLRYQMRLSWLLRDAVHGKDARHVLQGDSVDEMLAAFGAELDASIFRTLREEDA